MAIVLCIVGGSAVSYAQEARDPFAAIESADPMELARVVDRLGDGAVLRRLDRGRPRMVRLAAIRAAPFMRWPERALAPLAREAAGRDPDLAPAAAASLLRIAQTLTPDDLARREVSPASLTPVRRSLIAIARDTSARADLRAAADLADDALAALGVPLR